MPRRRRSQSPLQSPLILGLILFVLCLGGGYVLFAKVLKGGDNAEFHGVTNLNVQEYMENAKSLQGNVYQLEGRVEDQLRWSPDGRVLSVISQGNPVPVMIPPEFSNENIQPGQNFVFKVAVGERGVLIVQALKKA